MPAIAHIYFSWSCKSFVSEGSEVEGKKYGGDVLAVLGFLTNRSFVLHHAIRFALCEVR